MSLATVTTPLPVQRLHGLDALRGFALLLGVALHASMSYLPGSQYFWIVSETESSVALAVWFYWIHLFRMTTFFLLAGFFGRLALNQLGLMAFIRDRCKRILLPLLLAWPLVMTAIVMVVVWSAWIKFDGVLPAESPPGPAFTAADFPLTHLWFLYVLSLLYPAMLALRAALAMLDRGGRAQAALDRVVQRILGLAAPLLLAVPVGLALFSLPIWHAWFGVPTPDHSLYPNLAATVSFSLAFAVGWALERQRHLLAQIESRWPLNLALAVVATAGCLATIGLSPGSDPASGDLQTLAYALAYATAAWSWTLALVGMSLRFCSAASPLRRYLADASYWIYLIHIPLVMALQVVAVQMDWPWWIEYPLALSVAMGLMLVSYHYGVRNHAIGRLLNGKSRANSNANVNVAAAL
ncbi:MAG: acyltransferase family protein [Pseudomarimonas sp.]